jgi:EmrB/QacA subfamily drug resistance transporter
MTNHQAGTSSNRRGAVTIVVCLALGTVVAAMSSLNLALPGIARATHASQSDLEWVIDAYSLAFASLLLLGGALGDRYGRRRTLIIGLAIFGGGSMLAAVAHSANELIALRALVGVGAALVMPATLSTITGTYPPAERTRAVSTWAAVAGGAAILGLLAAGLLLAAFSWRSVFYLNVVLSTVALIGTLRFVPESADPDAPRLDVTGAALAVIGLVMVVYSVIEAPNYGWVTARTIGGLAGGLVVLAGFLIWESRIDAPMLDPRIFRNRRLSSGSLSILIQFFAFFGFTFTGLQYLEGVRGDTPLLAAVSVLPLAGSMMPTARMTPRLVSRFGARAVNVGGLILVAVGLAILARLGASTPYLLMLVGLVALGTGMGAAMTPATSAITESLPASQQGVGSALNDLSRDLGGALGIAVLGSLFDAGFRSHMVVTGLSPALAAKAKDSFAIALRLPEPTATHARNAFASGLHISLLAGAGAALAAALIAYVLQRPTASTATETATDEHAHLVADA